MGKMTLKSQLARQRRIMERQMKKKFTELESENLMIKDTVYLGNVEFQKAMEIFRFHYDGLCMKSEVKDMDFQDLLFGKSVVEGQLKACMVTIDGLIQRIAVLEGGLDGSRAEQGGGGEGKENRVLEFGIQSGCRMENGFELKNELGVYRARCEELSVKLENKKMECVMIEGKYKEMMSRNVGLDEKLVKYKNMCTEMNLRIRRFMDEERKAKCENEKRVQERIVCLEKEFKKKEINEKMKYGQLMAVNKDLECAKKRAEGENKVLKKRLVNLEKKMEGGLNEGNLKAVMSEKSGVDDVHKACKRTCEGLKDVIKCLEEEESLSLEREKKAQERIDFLEAEMKRVRSDEGENTFELIMKAKDLECAKISVEDENEILKKRVRDLETRVSRMEQVELEKAELEKEIQNLLTKYDELSVDLAEKKMEQVGIEYKRMRNELEVQNMGLEAVLKFINEKEKNAQDRVTNLGEEIMESDESEKYVKLEMEIWDLRCQKRKAEEEVESWKNKFKELNSKVLRLEEEIPTSSYAGCNHPSSIQGNVDGRVTGPASIIMQSRLFANVMEEQNNTHLQSKVQLRSSVRPASGGNVGICSPGDKKGHNCNFGGEEMLYVSTDNAPKRSLDSEKNLQSRKRSKSRCSEMKGEENLSSCDDDILSFSGLKRNSSKIVTSGSESEDDNRTRIGKLKMGKPQKLNEGVYKLSPLNLFGGNLTLSSRGQNVEESISPSKQKLVSPRLCKENNSRVNWKKTSRNQNASPNRLQMSGDGDSRRCN